MNFVFSFIHFKSFAMIKQNVHVDAMSHPQWGLDRFVKDEHILFIFF